MLRYKNFKKLINKQYNGKIVATTAYDYTTASLVDKSNIDLVLVGDSLANTFQGEADTLGVTLDEMIYHTKAVVKGCCQTPVVADMPFMTYQVSDKQALKSCGKLVKETKANAVKMEGGKEISDTIKKVVDAGIPVLGHIGLLPQHISTQGGYAVQGKSEETKIKIIEDAKAVQNAGAFALVIEGVKEDVAKAVVSSVEIPVIGIGASSVCDGQILVINDILGITLGQKPKFAKSYANLLDQITKSLNNYAKEVKSEEFPSKDHIY